jgi:tetratricopeptide (TPR) repeat protein/ADP-heptose:LPS heptosyltransferase
MSVQQTIALALNQYRSGDLPGAEETFLRLVETHRDSADGQCYLGIVRRARGNLEGALASYREAVRLRPDFAEAHNNLGNVLVLLRRYDEAISSYREALRLRPDYPQAHNGQGAALRNLGRLDEAMACYREALRLWPDYADAHNNLGDVFYRLGKPDEAIPHYQNALRVQLNFAEARNNLGAALTRLGRAGEAIAHHREALRLRPAFADAYTNLANALLKEKQFAEAVAAYRESLRLQPHSPEANSNLGIAFAEQRDWTAALACYEDALRLNPDYAEALTNKGNVLVECGRANEALACYERALALKPDYAEACDNLAQAFLALGRLDEAVACFDKALVLRPDYPEAHMGRALAWLVQGDYERGWPEYEWRWQCREFGGIPFTQPAWDGSPLEGRTILLHSEQGLGDTLQFVRYAPLVKERGDTVILACQKPLLPLLATCPGIDRLLAREESLPDFDVQAPLLSLPRLFGTTVATIPAPVPYLSARPELVEQWRQELAAYSGFKVGIAWQGNPRFGADRHRSFPLAHFEALARLPGVHLFSLQKKDGTEQLRDCPFPVIDLGPRLDETSGPFLDTAAVMKCLDLVICPNTSLAHLAGALGVPLWLPLPLAPEWRWLWGRDDSPWYPTARLFRQEHPGEWAPVFARMARDLTPARRASEGSSCITRSVMTTRRASEGRPQTRADTTTVTMAAALRCFQAGKLVEAERLCRQALQVKPDDPEALHLLGILAHQSGHADAAIASIERAVRLKPDWPEALTNLGAMHAEQGRLKEAVACFRQALAVAPNLAATHANLGSALVKLGQPAEAEQSFRLALRLQPDSADIHANLGVALTEQGRLEEALACYDHALRLRSDLASAHYHRGLTLSRQKKWEQAVASYRQAVHYQPAYVDAINNLGAALEQLGRLDEALACYDQTLRLKPDYAEGYNNRASALSQQGRLQEALADYDRALRLKPDFAEAHHSRAMLWLVQGDYDRGWLELEWRHRCPGDVLPPFVQPAWDGSPLRGRTILLYAEQGLGDTLQFVRYAPLVKERGGTVILACQKPLLRMLASGPGIDHLVAREEPLPDFDVYAPLMSLPRLFGTTVATIPAAVPYLSAAPELVEQWRQELAAYPGLKVGIAWQGNPRFGADRHRSFPLAHFEALARLPGVHLFSLQKKDGTEQLRDCPFPVIDLGPRLDEASGPFLDTAAVMKCLDLVICPNTSLAHLAGALGVGS